MYVYINIYLYLQFDAGFLRQFAAAVVAVAAVAIIVYYFCSYLIIHKC